MNKTDLLADFGSHDIKIRLLSAFYFNESIGQESLKRIIDCFGDVYPGFEIKRGIERSFK